jgi:hypothetical protein
VSRRRRRLCPKNADFLDRCGQMRTRYNGGCNRAFNSTKLPTSGAVPFRTDSRTRSSLVEEGGASICVTRSTKRQGGSPRRHRKTGRDRCDHHHHGKHLVPPQHKCRRAKQRRRDRGHPFHGLMIGGEVERDTGAEGDRHPRHQPAGARLGRDPFPQLCRERGPYPEARWHKTAGLRGAASGPGSGLAAALSPAPLCHAATPRTRPCGPSLDHNAIVRPPIANSGTDAESGIRSPSMLPSPSCQQEPKGYPK